MKVQFLEQIDWYPVNNTNKFSLLISANILARAEEDELDDVVDIEGEDSQVVGDDVLGDEDDSAVKSSQEVETTILFTKPITSLGDNIFGNIFKYL